MNANAAPVLALFEKKLRLEVPLFQRQYVWSREHQWEPLWEDLERKFCEYLEGRREAPVHFLGAMVLDQKQTPTTHVEKRQVIDGQQRLTTLQIFLSAFRDFCRDHGCIDLSDECESFTLNKGMMGDPETEKFKVWPTHLDRQQFADVITSKSRASLEERHPRRRRKYARKDEPRPRMVEAYFFFYNQLEDFFLGSNGDSPIASDVGLANRLEECFTALRNSLKVVVIDLENDDDAQVIFETLNARGEPLLPADLLRNFIFLRAARTKEPAEPLYQKYWSQFDDSFWRKEVKQGRLSRPRSDLFMQHFLASRQMVDIPIKHLFVEYKFWIDRKHPFETITEELATLARQGDHFRRIIEPRKGDPMFSLVRFLDCFDVRTSYPLLLYLLEHDISDADWSSISVILESYLLRRAVCGLSTKNYNRIFLTITRTLHREGTSPETLRKSLAEMSGPSSEWPREDAFRTAWLTQHAYHFLQQPKLVHILGRLNDTYLNNKTEKISIDGPLTVEHILPQSWTDQWPLQDGSQGVKSPESLTLDPSDPKIGLTRKRNALLQTFGNLTILTQPLNSSVSNGSWQKKRPEILKSSLLPINQMLRNYETWDEDAIIQRAESLFDRAARVWPGPEGSLT